MPLAQEIPQPPKLTEDPTRLLGVKSERCNRHQAPHVE
jgi:hypothetical protein